MAPLTLPRVRLNVDGWLRVAAFAVWIAFVLFCVGLSIGAGLCCADDGFRACVAKNIASGVGYATTLPESFDGTNKAPVPFDPGINTGPAFILPCAALIKLFGIHEITPGLTSILLWAGVFTAVFIRANRHVSGASLLLGIALFCFTVLAVFPHHIEHWHAYLAEVFAAALVIAAHWILGMEKFTPRVVFIAGLTAGLALQTKFIAAFVACGLVILFTLRAVEARLPLRRWLIDAALCLSGFLLPTLVFEFYKLLALGWTADVANWRDAIAGIRAMGLQSGGPPLREMIAQRLPKITEVFSVNATAAALLALVGIWRVRVAAEGDRWFILFVGMLTSVLIGTAYWLGWSVGWPRYLIVTGVVACFAFILPVFALRRGVERIVWALAVGLMIKSGLRHLPPRIASAADRGLFQPSNARLARTALAKKIDKIRKKESVVLATQWWATAIDIDFLLHGTKNFCRLEKVGTFPGHELIVLHRGLTLQPSEILAATRQKTKRLLFAESAYEMFEIEQ